MRSPYTGGRSFFFCYELEESATIDGCSRGMTFFRIVFPLLQPIIVTVLILNGIWIWNDYLLPLLVLGSNGEVQTIPIAVTSFAGAYLKQTTDRKSVV